MSRRRPRGAGQRGAISPMIIGFALILALLVSVVVAASRVFLFQRELSAMADGAALSAADGIDTSGIYSHENGEVRLDPVSASNLARSYLSDSNATDRFPGLATDVTVVTPTRVQVRLAANCRIPLVTSVISSATMPVSATAEAQSQRR
jgi:uncharacterized membrane protein